ncbi:MAG: segregation/condensation protein A [bacterium]|nr:segregation/condensation protein A [bacterium]
MDTQTSSKYELDMADFKGPLEKLLELIEEKQLEITRLNLAEVTSDFLAYVAKLGGKVGHREVADFVVVAAKLILIKSHALLPHLAPSKEEERDMAELEGRLRLYKELREGEKVIDTLWGKHVSYGRAFLKDIPEGFYLSEKVTPGQLHGYIKDLAGGLVELQKMEEGEVKMVNLEEKIKELLGWIGQRVQASFTDMSKGKQKPEVVVMFLALLHLLKDTNISVEQDALFADIKIAHNHG